MSSFLSAQVDASVDVRAQLKQASANMPLVPAFLEAFVTAPVSRLGCGAPLDALGRISARREQHKSIEALRSSRVAEWVASARASGISEQLLLHAQRFHDTGHDVSRCRAPECPDQPRRAAFELFCRRLRKFDADADESRRTQSLLDEKAAAPIHRYLVRRPRQSEGSRKSHLHHLSSGLGALWPQPRRCHSDRAGSMDSPRCPPPPLAGHHCPGRWHACQGLDPSVGWRVSRAAPLPPHSHGAQRPQVSEHPVSHAGRRGSPAPVRPRLGASGRPGRRCTGRIVTVHDEPLVSRCAARDGL